jgi:hypothetical protein
MKYIVLILWVGFVLAIGKGERSTKERTIISVDSTSHIDDYTYSKWDTFVDAVIYVESRGNDSAVGDNGKAVGCLQMHPIMVREVNRILAKYDIPTTYTLEDRYSRDKSIEMFNIISEEYYCCEDYTFTDYVEIVARRWNGGPRGDKKRSTIKYWNNVQKRI